MKKTFSIIGIILGIVIVVVGLYTAFGFKGYYSGTSTSSYTFGADFYTEQYTATEHAADNILSVGHYLDDVVEFAFKAIGLFIAVLGGTITCYFGCKLADVKNPQITSAPITVKQESQAEVSEELPEI